MDADALREVKEQSNFTNFERIEKNIVVLERFLQLWGKGKAKKVQKKISEHFDAGALWVAVVEYLDRLDRSLGKTFMERVFDDIDAGRVPEHSHLGQLLKVREDTRTRPTPVSQNSTPGPPAELRRSVPLRSCQTSSGRLGGAAT